MPTMASTQARRAVATDGQRVDFEQGEVVFDEACKRRSSGATNSVDCLPPGRAGHVARLERQRPTSGSTVTFRIFPRCCAPLRFHPAFGGGPEGHAAEERSTTAPRVQFALHRQHVFTTSTLFTGWPLASVW